MIPFTYIDNQLYIDFRTLNQLTSHSISRSSLYRRIIKAVPRRNFGNKKLILFRDILVHPVLSKLIDRCDVSNDI